MPLKSFVSMRLERLVRIVYADTVLVCVAAAGEKQAEEQYGHQCQEIPEPCQE